MSNDTNADPSTQAPMTAEERISEHTWRNLGGDLVLFANTALRLMEEHALAAVEAYREQIGPDVTTILDARDRDRAELARARELLVEARPLLGYFGGRWGRWIEARAEHGHPSWMVGDEWRHYMTVREYTRRAADLHLKIIAPSAAEPGEEARG